jgi:glucuronoxylan 4-O-methyltransferase
MPDSSSRGLSPSGEIIGASETTVSGTHQWDGDALERLCVSFVSPNQMSTREYVEIARVITRLAPCAVCVYGVGNDSALWMQVNSGGRTLFIEESPEWLARVTARLPGIEALQFSYDTTVERSLAGLTARQRTPAAGVEWDVIVIDGPEGWSAHKPGREVPIAEAAEAMRRRAAEGGRLHVFVHDFDRPLERQAATALLSVIPGVRSAQYDRTAHYWLD